MGGQEESGKGCQGLFLLPCPKSLSQGMLTCPPEAALPLFPSPPFPTQLGSSH